MKKGGIFVGTYFIKNGKKSCGTVFVDLKPKQEGGTSPVEEKTAGSRFDYPWFTVGERGP